MPSHSKRDEGFTLVELLVYCLLLVLVLSVVAGLIMSTTSTAKNVGTTTSTTTQVQELVSTLDSGVGNASAFMSSVVNGSDEYLVARTAQRGSSLAWSCSAWYYSATAGQVRYTLGGGTNVAPSAATVATWTLLGSGIGPQAGSTIFGGTGNILTIGFTATAGSDPAIPVSTSVVSQNGARSAAPC